MSLPRSLRRNRASSVALHAVLLLSFLQLLAVFIEAVYAFGLLQTSIPAEIASVVLLFAPLLLLAWRRPGGRALFAIGLAVLAGRVLSVLFDGPARMVLAGIGTGAYLFFLPAYLTWLGRERRASEAPLIGLGLVLAVALSGALRAWGAGLDLSLEGTGQIAGLVLAAGAGVLLGGHFGDELPGQGRRRRRRVDPSGPMAPIGWARSLAFVWGLVSGLVLVYFVLMAPNVSARWVGLPLPLVTGMLGAALVGAALWLQRPSWVDAAGRRTLPALGLALAAALAATILPHHVHFPADPGAYPLTPPAVSVLAAAPLFLFLALSPVLFVAVTWYLRALVNPAASAHRLGGLFAIGSLYLLVMILAHVFTTVYDYIPIVGPFFRDRFWLVHLVAALGLALPLLALPAGPQDAGPWVGRLSPATVSAALAVTAVAGAWLLQPTPAPLVSPATLRVLTYNIQQGYDEAGRRNLTGQLGVMRALGPDLIGLQESDTNRIAGGNADVVRWLARALDMHAYYGPSPVVGTFGIALLSRFPLLEPRTFYMFSEGEQTATIQAGIVVEGRRYEVFVTHLGNGGPLVQQRAILKEVEGHENVILMGDFNFRPGTAPFAATEAVLDSAWQRLWTGGVDDAGIGDADKIDHVFVSPDLAVTDARYLLSPASDHPAFFVTVAHPP